MSRKRLIPAVAVLILLSASLAAVRPGDIYFQIKKQLTIYSDIYSEIVTLYVDELSPSALMKSGIESMLQSLDPYTTFIDEGEEQQMEILATGNYGGVGIDAGYRNDSIVVIAPLDGYPADRAGIRAGDIIVSIDKVSTEGMTPEEIQRLTIGDIGTTIQIEIERRGLNQMLRFDLERERIEVKNITYADLIGDEGDIAYIQMIRFGQRTSEELWQQLVEYRENGAVNGLILDLRNNPGGLLNEAVDVVDKFIEPGEKVVETRGRLRDHSNSYYSGEPPVFEDLPVVILLNEGSASASEVVAGALQDLDRAVILGQTSFGKGLVQTIRPLSYNTSLKITVSRYYTPSGRSIQAAEYNHQSDSILTANRDLQQEFRTRNGRTIYGGTGIEPDIAIEEPSLSMLETTLKQQDLYFFFVSDLISESYGGNMAGGDVEGLPVPDNLFEKFRQYLNEEGFSYETAAGRQIQELENSLDHFSDRERAADILKELKHLDENQKNENFLTSREAVEAALKLEWVSRSFGESKKMQVSLSNDRYVSESLGILQNNDRYKQILNN